MTLTSGGTGNTRRGPLSDLRIIEFAGMGPGTFAGMILADLGARKGTMTPFTKIFRNNQGMSITRGSFKNSDKYLLTSEVLGLSGVPN